MSVLAFLKSTEVKAFIRLHEKSDVNSLILNPPAPFQGRIKPIADQILSRQKAEGKLPQWLENPNVIFPVPLSVEQSSSETTASYKAMLMEKGEHLVDLTGGMGVDCLALSSAFRQTTYVEQNQDLCELFSWNSQCLGKEVTVRNQSAESFLQSLGNVDFSKLTFYLDPARRDQGRKTVLLEDCAPNALEIIPALLERGAKVLLKTSPLLDIQSTIGSFEELSEVHVVAVKNEVKEVLYKFSSSDLPTKVVAINLPDRYSFHFTYKEEKETLSDHASTSTYLYEANAAILKAGAFKIVGKRYGLNKIDVHSHFYTSSKIVDPFPGKIFKVLKQLTKEELKKLKGSKKNVISRNHPLKAEQFKKKYGIKDGGKDFIIATKELGKPIVLLTQLES